MYKEYFGLKEGPFSISPDPRFLFMSEGHQEALAHLFYGINSDGGFVLLTGEVGTGKTTVCRCLLEQVPEDSDIAFILNPKLTVEELLATICDELGISYPEDNTRVKVFIDRINTYLLDAHERGRRTILIIEEAQNLLPDVLEQVRLLTNLETDKRKLLQIIMLGQPELGDMLSRPELRQLAQRITARYHLGPLSKKDVASYVVHRLSVAGGKGSLFPESVVNRIYSLSKGIPRLVNVLCDRSLLGAYVEGKENVDIRTVDSAAREVFGTPAARWYKSRQYQYVMAAIVIIACLLSAVYFIKRPNTSGTYTLYRTADKSFPLLISPGQRKEPLSALIWDRSYPKGQSSPFGDAKAQRGKVRAAGNSLESGGKKQSSDTDSGSYGISDVAEKGGN